MLIILVLIILGGGAYAGERFYGPVINPAVVGIVASVHLVHSSPSTPSNTSGQANSPQAVGTPAPQTSPTTFNTNEVVKVVNGTGFTFMAPASWTDSSAVGDGCQEESIVNSDQTLDTQGNPQGNPGQIDVWPKNCIPSELTYKNQTEKNGFLISTNFDEDTAKQIAETQDAYKLVVDTFKLTP